MLHPQAFLQIQQHWGPLVVDLFASRLYPPAEILQLETRPRGRGSGCFQSGLDTTPAEDVFNLRPPLPRYESTWDVCNVLDYLVSLGSSGTLPLKYLAWKLAMLWQTLQVCRSSKARLEVQADYPGGGNIPR